MVVRKRFSERVFGQPIQFGIKIDNSKDTNYIDTVHFWVYWQDANTPESAYQLANGTAIGLFRCDNPLISNVFAYNYNVGLSLSNSPTGIPHKVHLVNADFDNCDNRVPHQFTRRPGQPGQHPDGKCDNTSAHRKWQPHR